MNSQRRLKRNRAVEAFVPSAEDMVLRRERDRTIRLAIGRLRRELALDERKLLPFVLDRIANRFEGTPSRPSFRAIGTRVGLSPSHARTLAAKLERRLVVALVRALR